MNQTQQVKGKIKHLYLYVICSYIPFLPQYFPYTDVLGTLDECLAMSGSEVAGQMKRNKASSTQVDAGENVRGMGGGVYSF